MSTSPLRIAIVGGSMSGCLFALGLHNLHKANISFDVFEAWTFSERGAGVGVHPNGHNALHELGVDADALLHRAGAFKEKACEAVVAFGEHEGKYLMNLPGGVQCVMRTTLLAEILKLVPEERLHDNKKLVCVDERESLTLHFEDGTSHEADALVGCDGLRSTVRRLVLGKDHPAVPPKFTGYWDARAFSSAERTKELFGAEIIQHENPREYFKVGEGCTMLFASAPKGQMGGVVVAGLAGPEERDMIDDHKKLVTREFLEKNFAGWKKKYVDGVIDCLLDPTCGPGFLFGEYESQDAPTWCRNRMMIIGDAAHAALPWMGQGFSMAAEDAAILSALLGHIESRQDFQKAFEAFDKVRRGAGSRPDFVVKKNAIVASLCNGERGLDPAAALNGIDDINSLFAYLWQGDIKTEVKDAVDVFEKLKCNGGSLM